MNKEFINAIENENLNEIRKIPKGDLHNHGTRGGNISYIEKLYNLRIPRLNMKFNNLNEMQKWYDENIKTICKGQLGYERRIEAAFDQAREDGITHLQMSFGFNESSLYDNKVDLWINTIRDISDCYPEIHFMPEIAFLYGMNEERAIDELKQVLDYNYFISIDICGDELAAKAKDYKRLYRIAKDNKFLLKAHVGEFGSAESVKEAVGELALDQVQHGIAASNSTEVMNYLLDNNIQLNICPSSNVLLKRVHDYQSHPIKKFYDHGIKVTINSDDMLIFNQSVSKDYLNLYQARRLNAYELDQIRMNSL